MTFAARTARFSLERKGNLTATKPPTGLGSASKFTGQMRDTESGEDFFNARYMSSGLTRFMSADPYNAGADVTNPQSWNGYGYVLGNPLRVGGSEWRGSWELL